MKKILTTLTLAASTLHAADPEHSCDLMGANPIDPALPQGTPYRYYHNLSDTEAVQAAIRACTQAYEDSKDPRYLYQRANIRTMLAMQTQINRIHTTEKPTLRDYGLEQTARYDMQQAAEQGYIAARYQVARWESLEQNSAAPFDALKNDAPGLAHLGIGHYHLQATRYDPSHAAEHRAQAADAFQKALDHGIPAWSALAQTQTMPDSLATLEEGYRKHETPILAGQLALFYDQTGRSDKADAILAAMPDTPDNRVEKDYVQGMRYLNGKDAAAREKGYEHIRRAAENDHPTAQVILPTLDKKK